MKRFLLPLFALAILVAIVWHGRVRPVPPAEHSGTEPAWKTIQIFEPGTGVLRQGFRLSYPEGFTARTGDDCCTSGSFIGDGVLTVAFPERAFADEHTNFVEAWVNVSRATGTEAASSCSATVAGTSQMKAMQKNGRTFWYEAFTDVGAGQIYDARIYRTQAGEACYEVTLTVHTGNIGMYPEGIAAFDTERAWATLDGIFATFVISTSPVRP